MSDAKKIKEKVVAGETPAIFLHKARINTCNTCPHLIKITRICGKCFCLVDLKVRLTEQQCPEDKW
jgi:hypothetical protein